MQNAKIQNDIVNLENKYWDALRNNDVESAIKLTAFPCVIAGSEGVRRVNENQFREMMSKHDMTPFRNVTIDNPEVSQLSGDAAVITYTTLVDGKRVVDVSTWINKDGRWLCGFHSENPMH